MRYIYNTLTVQTKLDEQPSYSITDEIAGAVCDAVDRIPSNDGRLLCDHEIPKDYSFLRFSSGESDGRYIDDEIHELSLFFPQLFFVLDVEDADNGIWREYYHAGQYQSCDSHIVYDPPCDTGWKNYDEVEKL